LGTVGAQASRYTRLARHRLNQSHARISGTEHLKFIVHACGSAVQGEVFMPAHRALGGPNASSESICSRDQKQPCPDDDGSDRSRDALTGRCEMLTFF